MKTNLKLRSWMQVVIASLILLASGVAHGQEEKEMEAILNEINNLYTSKIEEAAKKDQNRFSKMKSELEEIEKIKENQGKKKAVENYSKNNKAAYGQIVREAGVNPNSVVARLKSKFPGYTFSVIEDYSILVERTVSESDPSVGTGSLTPQKNFPTDGKTIEPDTYPAATSHDFLAHYPIYNDLFLASNGNLGRGPMTEAVFETNNEFPSEWFSGIASTQELSFTQSKTVNCFAGSGGNVELGARHLKAYSTGVVGGSCSSSGRLESNVALPSTGIQSIRLRLNYTLEVSGFALGIFGTSVTSASCGVAARTTDHQNWFSSNRMDRMAIAPVFWFASFNDSRNYPVFTDTTLAKGKTLLTYGFANSQSTSVMCCATNSFARATITGASLEFVK